MKAPPVAFMWHRGITHGQARQLAWFMEAADGPWNYFFLLYRRRNPEPEWEVLVGGRSIRQIATRWEQASRDSQPALADATLLSSSFRVA